MSKYQKYATKALEKLKKYGEKVVVKHPLQEEYNEETNEYQTEYVEFEGYGLLNKFDFQNINGTTVQVGDVVVQASLPLSPQVSDTVIYGNKEYKVVSYTAENPDGNCAIYYDILCR